MQFLIITGISGAGKSLCMNYLEDIGFYCVDNLPPMLIPKFAEICRQSSDKMDKVAMVVDIRGRNHFNELFPALDDLASLGIAYDILFLESDDKILIKRFKESRRMHPLSQEGRIIEGIEEERRILHELKNRSTYVLDTSNFTPRQLKEELVKLFIEGQAYSGLFINIVSFGFKYGIPIDSDLVFDVRFIPNPYYIDELRPKNGLDIEVKNYVFNCLETKMFVTKLNDMIDFLIPCYIKEGKTQLVISIGCTGGCHRSVAIAQKIYSILVSKKHRAVVTHRDVGNDIKGAVK